MVASEFSTTTHLALYNVQALDAVRRDRSMDTFVEAMKTTVRRMPGFVSAHLRLSLNRDYVGVYTRWETGESFEAMLRDAQAQRLFWRAAAASEGFDPGLFDGDDWTEH
jgi:heme-degrading monooxygenase HmoA